MEDNFMNPGHNRLLVTLFLAAFTLAACNNAGSGGGTAPTGGSKKVRLAFVTNKDLALV